MNGAKTVMNHQRKSIVIHIISLLILLLATCNFALADEGYDDVVNDLVAKAQAGDTDAQKKLGAKFADGMPGQGVPKDEKQAAFWFSKAAEKNDAQAQVFLGYMYETGSGVLKDYEQAVFWYTKAANQENPYAQMMMGKMYIHGIGVQQDYIEAYKWFDLASTSNDSVANSHAKDNLEGLEKKMTAEQINEAQERARLWKPETITEATGLTNTDENYFDKYQAKITISKNNGGVFEIPVILNGVLTIKFIIDSGAADVQLSPDVAHTLFKTGTVRKADFLEGAVYQFADGSTAKSARFVLRSVKIGSKTIKNVICSIANSDDASLLLGQSALQKLGTYKIDYKTNQISFE